MFLNKSFFSCSCLVLLVVVCSWFVPMGYGILWSQSMGSSCASLVKLWSHFEKLHNYNTFLYSIEDISVSLCCKNSNLVGKTLADKDFLLWFAPPCECHWGYTSTYIYRNTQKWFLEWWYNVAYTEINTWHSLFSGYNCGAGAG